MSKKRIIPPPYKNKAIEFINLISKKKRAEAIEKAGFNTFLLDSGDVYIDFLTDSGTSAMSDNQWAGMMLGDEAYAGSKNFYSLEKAMQDVFGYKYLVPTHQGRGAEHIMAQVLVKKKGQFVPNNLYFTTSRFHQEHAGGVWVDVSISEAKDPQNSHPFKGNTDTAKLESFIKEKGQENIAFVRVEASVNMAGGQPFSMANLKEVSSICRKYNLFLLIDSTRIVENAHFIRERESGYENKNLKEIVHEICSYTDGCTMSSKKDHFVSIGGFLATNDEGVFTQAKELVVVFEGLHTYGGMAGRDMEALSIGIRESVEKERLVDHYVGQVAYVANSLLDKRIPIVEPPGAHAVFLDAKRFFPHIPQEQFPAQALTAEIYEEGGVRTMERGIVSGQHGKEPYHGLELVRVTIPRRVYELAHLIYTVDVIEKVWNRREQVKGLKISYEPPSLRFFQARFKRA